MNEKSYTKRLEFQQKMISRKTEEVESLKLEIEKLKQKLEEKDELISAIEPMRKEMAESIEEHKKQKIEYSKIVDELKRMKKILDKTVYKGRWWLVKFLIK